MPSVVARSSRTVARAASASSAVRAGVVAPPRNTRRYAVPGGDCPGKERRGVERAEDPHALPAGGEKTEAVERNQNVGGAETPPRRRASARTGCDATASPTRIPLRGERRGDVGRRGHDNVIGGRPPRSPSRHATGRRRSQPFDRFRETKAAVQSGCEPVGEALHAPGSKTGEPPPATAADHPAQHGTVFRVRVRPAAETSRRRWWRRRHRR